MNRIARFPYAESSVNVRMPYIDVLIDSGQVAVRVKALLDSGAMVNVIPKQVGERLNLNWEEGVDIVLSGNLGKAPARAFYLNCTVQGLEVTQLELNWSMLEDIPVILGQFDFFQNFDVCFSYSENEISVRPKRVQQTQGEA